MGVKSSVTVFRALKLLAKQMRPVGSAEMADALGVPISTAVRAIATLEAAGYAERHRGAARFVIGKSARALAYAFMAQFPLRDLAMPYLQQLTLEAALTSSLFVRVGWFTVRVGRILGPRVLIHQSNLGEALPLEAAGPPLAPSLAILAHLTAAERARVPAPTMPSGERTEAERSRAAVLRDGLAVEPSAAGGDAFDVAAPLFDSDGQVIGAVAVEGASADALPAITAADGVVRRIMAELARKVHGERAVDLSHYGHIDPDQIAF